MRRPSPGRAFKMRGRPKKRKSRSRKKIKRASGRVNPGKIGFRIS